jgi:beta-phosphoglucomutase
MIVTTPVRALIFDFDGVLADTEDLHCAAFQSVAAEAGLTLSRDDYYAQLLGLPDRECLAAVCARAGMAAAPARLDDLVARKRRRFAQLAQDARLYAGVADTLRRLHPHFLLGIASGAFRDEIEPILEREHVRQLFTAVVGAEDVRNGKPAPDPFLQALHALQSKAGAPLTPADCLVIEDSPHGITAAHAAGMHCLGVTTHHDHAALATAEAIIARVSELRPEDLMS